MRETPPAPVLSRIERGLPDADGIHPLNIAPSFRGHSVRACKRMAARVQTMEG
jgi:hypothetical protein